VPDLPTWLIEILRQFPMVVVIGYAIWYAEKRVREKEIRLEERYDRDRKVAADRDDKYRTELRGDRDAEIKRSQETQKTLTEAYEKVVTAKDEQIANLTKQLAALTRKLSG
jgi:hypothetical protein